MSAGGRRLPPFWTAQILGWSAYALVFHVLAMPTLEDASLRAHLGHLGSKLWMSAMGLGASLVLAHLYDRLWPRRVGLPALFVTAAGASLVAGFAWFGAYRYTVLLANPASAAFSDFPRGALTYVIALLAWSALYFSFSYRRDLEAETERALRATALAAQAELKMLRYQVNPHFLFNALNSIRALIDEDPERARAMVTRLAELFRYSLVNGQTTDAPLADEIQAIRNYLAIQSIRFEERLEVACEADAGAAAVRLPGFLIHPLVENAVKYGMQTSPMPLRVAITASLANGTLRVEVANTGHWATAGNGLELTGTGTGLENVRRRLEHAFPGRHRFDLREEEGWVRARLDVELPFP